MQTKQRSQATPLEDVCAHLARSVGAERLDAATLRRLRGFGGPWGLVPQWPRGLARRRIDGDKTRRERWLSPQNWFRGRRRATADAKSSADLVSYASSKRADALERLACRADGWLFARSVAWLARILGLSDPASAFPFASMTHQGLEMAVVACAARNGGIVSDDAAPEFDEQASVGDLLALHLIVEDWLDESAPQSVAPSETPRLGGGLRRPSALRWPGSVLAPALLRHARTGGSPDLRLEWLVRKSPLTQLVYLDVFGGAPPTWAVRTLLLSTDDRISTADRSTTRHLWIARLAKSLHAAAISPARSQEAQRLLTAHGAALRSRAAALRSRAKIRAVRTELSAVESLRDTLTERVRSERVQRVVTLGDLFRGAAPELLGLQYLFLELLSRNAVRRSFVEARRRWIAEFVTDSFAPGDVFFWGPQSCHEAECFAQLLGGSPSWLAGAGTSSPVIRDALRHLLDPPAIVDDEAKESCCANTIARCLGIVPPDVRRWRARFSSAEFGEPTPAPPPYDGRGPALSALIAQWLVSAMRQLPDAEPSEENGSDNNEP